MYISVSISQFISISYHLVNMSIFYIYDSCFVNQFICTLFFFEELHVRMDIYTFSSVHFSRSIVSDSL